MIWIYSTIKSFEPLNWRKSNFEYQSAASSCIFLVFFAGTKGLKMNIAIAPPLPPPHFPYKPLPLHVAVAPLFQLVLLRWKVETKLKWTLKFDRFFVLSDKELIEIIFKLVRHKGKPVNGYHYKIVWTFFKRHLKQLLSFPSTSKSFWRYL